MTRVPAPARWLLRLSPVPRAARAEVESDLHELYAARRRDRGAVHAHLRLYHDIGSLWIRRRSAVAADAPRSTSAYLRDARGDLRYAARLFARQPAILLLTIVGLSLGLGIATAAFSVMNAAVLRGDGLVESDRAPGVLKTTERSVSTVWTYDEFLHLRAGSTRMQVEALVTDAAEVRTTAGDANARPAILAFVSGGFFAATGGTMHAGRPLELADETPPGPPPIVVSFGFWTSALNQDPSVIGRPIWIGRSAATIVGVAAREFTLPRSPLLWMPLTAYGSVYSTAPVRRTPGTSVEVFGRLLPGVALAEAGAQLSGVAAALPRTATGESLRVRLDTDTGLGRASPANAVAVTVVLFALIGLVLVLAWANVASVLVSTAIAREREMGVRAALGASRGRITRQLVTESLALGAMAAGVGLLFAYWMLPVIGRMIDAPAGADFAPDLAVYLFLGIVTLVTSVCAGLAPAWHGRGVDLVTPLKGSEGARQHRVAPRRLRSMLVITQAAVSLLLIVTATLFVRATIRAAAVDVGFDATGLYTVMSSFDRVAPNDDGSRLRAFWARAIPDVKGVPGVSAVALSELTPFGAGIRTSITRTPPARTVHLNRTAVEYFETLGLRLLAGRIYTRAEVAAGAPVAIVSQSLARAYWPDRSPLGELLPEDVPLASTRPLIIGVVSDVITARLHERSTFALYEPLPPGYGFTRLLIRVDPGARGAVDEAGVRLRAIDPEADVHISSIAAALEQRARQPLMLATLTGLVGIIAILLCVVGLYGLTASVIGQRSREMAVRAAIGADRGELLRLLMWESLRPVVLGLAIGSGIALLAGRMAESAMFFGVSPQDPIAFAGAAVILIVATILAVLAPTRRAAAVDAAAVLRSS